jgi:hypothetical protein
LKETGFFRSLSNNYNTTEKTGDLIPSDHDRKFHEHSSSWLYGEVALPACSTRDYTVFNNCLILDPDHWLNPCDHSFSSRPYTGRLLFDPLFFFSEKAVKLVYQISREAK